MLLSELTCIVLLPNKPLAEPGQLMARTIIEADIEDVEIKKPSRGSKGACGVIYVPKAWIGKQVYVVLKR